MDEALKVGGNPLNPKDSGRTADSARAVSNLANLGRFRWSVASWRRAAGPFDGSASSPSLRSYRPVAVIHGDGQAAGSTDPAGGGGTTTTRTAVDADD